VPIIGSDQHQQFNQLEISDIIEARLEEVLDLISHEMRRMGIRDLPGGYVLTGGVSNLPGVLELAQIVFQNRVRVAIPDYIGVREPQYTTAVGLIKYAQKNARLQGRVVSAEPVAVEAGEKRQQKPSPKKPKPAKVREEVNEEDKPMSKMKKFFGYFFE
jgi:cell division protein FtsA